MRVVCSIMLLAAVSGQAEDAWVLWVVRHPEVAWDRKEAFASLAECLDGREKAIQGVLATTSRATFKETERTENTVSFRPRAGKPWSTEYLCLPDTINPAAAKVPS